MKKRTLAVITALFLVGGAIGALSYTTASVDRGATIAVEADSSAQIGLSPGVTGISTTDDRLNIDLGAEGSGTGLNEEANFTYGTNSSSATTTYAFSVTNNDGQAHLFDFAYVLGSDPAGSTDNVNYEVWDDTGTYVGNFNESSDLTGVSIASGTTYYVVIDVNTTNVETANNLDGTLYINSST